MTDLYYIITTGPDGPNLNVMTKAQLEKALNENYWGSSPVFIDATMGTHADLAAGFSDHDEHGQAILIIKGGIVLPSAKRVVETWEVT